LGKKLAFGEKTHWQRSVQKKRVDVDRGRRNRPEKRNLHSGFDGGKKNPSARPEEKKLSRLNSPSLITLRFAEEGERKGRSKSLARKEGGILVMSKQNGHRCGSDRGLGAGEEKKGREDYWKPIQQEGKPAMRWRKQCVPTRTAPELPRFEMEKKRPIYEKKVPESASKGRKHLPEGGREEGKKRFRRQTRKKKLMTRRNWGFDVFCSVKEEEPSKKKHNVASEETRCISIWEGKPES